MATIEEFQERLRLAVREALQKVLAEGDLPEAGQGEAQFTDDRDSRPGGGRCRQPGSVRAAVGGKRHGTAALSALWLRRTAHQAAGSHGANATRLGRAAERARVLLPRLSPGFFSLGPKLSGWTWTMTTVRRP